jgi:hypothetical protein
MEEQNVAIRTDGMRLDWLERMAKEKGGLLLHSETEYTGRVGLGLARPDRTLRKAIDAAMAGEQRDSASSDPTPAEGAK